MGSWLAEADDEDVDTGLSVSVEVGGDEVVVGRAILVFVVEGAVVVVVGVGVGATGGGINTSSTGLECAQGLFISL